MAKRIARAAIPIVMLATAFGFTITRPHHWQCQILPEYTPSGQPKLEHVAKSNAPEGYRLVSPSINCGRCHDPKVHTLIP